MCADSAVKIWLDPWKYWSATADMSREETAFLIEKVMHYAETGNVDALKQYTFVTIEGSGRGVAPAAAAKRLFHAISFMRLNSGRLCDRRSAFPA